MADLRGLLHYSLTSLKDLPHVTISSTMVFNVAKIASARASSTISLTKSLRVAGPCRSRIRVKDRPTL